MGCLLSVKVLTCVNQLSPTVIIAQAISSWRRKGYLVLNIGGFSSASVCPVALGPCWGSMPQQRGQNTSESSLHSQGAGKGAGFPKSLPEHTLKWPKYFQVGCTSWRFHSFFIYNSGEQALYHVGFRETLKIEPKQHLCSNSCGREWFMATGPCRREGVP